MVSPRSAPRATRAVAPVLEVFASIQGEGAYVGELQTFVRLRGCPMRCVWCDTPGSWELGPDDRARIATPDGPRRESAWASPFQVACWIAEVEPGEGRTVSVTGGEPLVWPGFLRELRRMLGSRRMHLETGGGHPRALESVLESFQHVSLDLKLPSDMLAPVELALDASAEAEPTAERAPATEREWTAARRAALALLAGRDACAKVIVAAGHATREHEPLLEDVARLAPAMPVVVQPVTPVRDVRAPAIDEIVAVAELARELGLSVRVLPQVHRALAVP